MKPHWFRSLFKKPTTEENPLAYFTHCFETGRMIQVFNRAEATVIVTGGQGIALEMYEAMKQEDKP